MTTIYFHGKARAGWMAVLAFTVVSMTGASAQMFTPGDLVVTTYGNVGNAATNSTFTDGQPTPISLLEFSTSGGSPVLTYTLPTVDSGSNVGVVGEFGSSSEGTIQLSGDGRYLTFAGYSAAQSYAGNYSVNTTALAQSTDTAVPRVAVLVDANGNVNSSTVLNDIYSSNNPRSVYSANGSTLYLSGQGPSASDEGGLYRTSVGNNTTSGGTAPTPIYNAVSTRTVSAYNGNLYYSADQNSSKKGTQTGIFEYSGLPTTSQGSSTGIRLTLANNGAGINYSPQGFFFADANTLYVADTGIPKAGGTGDGGIQKWALISGTWTLEYTLAASTFVAPSLATSAAHGETGFEAITGQVTGDTVNLFAVSYTAGDADPNGLYAVTDSLSATTYSGSGVVELAQSGANNNFKGVSFAPTPEPSTFSLMLVVGGLAVGFGVWKRKKASAV